MAHAIVRHTCRERVGPVGSHGSLRVGGDRSKCEHHGSDEVGLVGYTAFNGHRGAGAVANRSVRAMPRPGRTGCRAG